MMHYLSCTCQCGLHSVLWRILICLLTAEPSSTLGPLFLLCPRGRILLTLYSMVWNWRVSRAGPMLIYWPKLLYPFFYFCLQGGVVRSFALIGCKSHSPSLSIIIIIIHHLGIHDTPFSTNNSDLNVKGYSCTIIQYPRYGFNKKFVYRCNNRN